MFLSLTNIKKSFGQGDSRVEVLKGIDLSIEKGDEKDTIRNVKNYNYFRYKKGFPIIEGRSFLKNGLIIIFHTCVQSGSG